MPVNYRNYLVTGSPLPAIEAGSRIAQRAQQNVLAQRGMKLQEDREKRMAESANHEAEIADYKKMISQMDALGSILEPIVDEESHRVGVEKIKAAVQEGLLDEKVLNFVPPNYDPASLEYSKSFINSFRDKIKDQLVVTSGGELAVRSGGRFERGDVTPSMAEKLAKGDPAKKTAWQGFFANNPDATDDQIASFAQKLKGGGISVETPEGTKVRIGGGSGQDKPMQRAIGKEFGKGIGERSNKRTEGGLEAQNQNFQLDLVKEAITQGARTGYGEETLLNIRSAAQTFGIDTGDLSGQELIRKISNEMALRLRNPESGLGLTGNTSNKDLDFLKASVVGLARTEAGNLKIIDAMKKLNGIKLKVAKKQSEIIRKNGGSIPTDIDDQIMSYVDGLTVFTDSEMSEMQRLSQRIVKRYKHKKNGRTVVELEDGSLEYAD